MYNEKRKQRFLNTLSRVHATFTSSVFRSAEEKEEELGVDIAELPVEALQEIFDENFGFLTENIMRYINQLEKYINWCKDQGYPTTTNYKYIDINVDEKLKKRLVASPQHLEMMLNRHFSPAEEKNVDCLSRLYYWAAFSNFPRSLVNLLEVKHINLDAAMIEFDGSTYEIYREAFPTLKVLMYSDSFFYRRSSSWEKRVDGTRLLRTARSKAVINQIMEEATARAARTKNINDFVLSYPGISLSGHFYRLYETERIVGSDKNVNQLKKLYDEMHPEIRAKKIQTQSGHGLIYKNEYLAWKRIFS